MIVAVAQHCTIFYEKKGIDSQSYNKILLENGIEVVKACITGFLSFDIHDRQGDGKPRITKSSMDYVQQVYSGRQSSPDNSVSAFSASSATSGASAFTGL